MFELKRKDRKSIDRRHHRGAGRALPALAALAGCALALAACGASSSPKAASTATAAADGGGAGGQRFAAARACLQKQGVTLPQRPPGGQGANAGRGPGSALFGGGQGAGGAAGPNGGPRAPFNTPAFQAAARKCGLTPRRFTRNPATFQASVTKFVACVRQNGYNLPAPNFTGKGPVFQASQVNRSDPKFAAASQKCQSLLRPSGPPGGGPAGGGPPTPAAP